MFPPWKYNSLAQIKFGQRLRLDIRYGGDAWHKMILARVTDLQFGFPSERRGPAHRRRRGHPEPPQDQAGQGEAVPDRKEDFIVQRRARRSKAKDLGLGFTGASRSAIRSRARSSPWPELDAAALDHAQQGDEYLQFLQGIAERMDFELFVDFTERLILDSNTPPKTTQRGHAALRAVRARSSRLTKRSI